MTQTIPRGVNDLAELERELEKLEAPDRQEQARRNRIDELKLRHKEMKKQAADQELADQVAALRASQETLCASSQQLLGRFVGGLAELLRDYLSAVVPALATEDEAHEDLLDVVAGLPLAGQAVLRENPVTSTPGVRWDTQRLATTLVTNILRKLSRQPDVKLAGLTRDELQELLLS